MVELTKNTKSAIVITLIVILSINILGCSSSNNPNNGLITLTLNKEITIPQEECLKRNLQGKVLVLESENCGVCRIVVPILKEIEKEVNNKNIEFIFLDLSTNKDRKKMEEFKVTPHYTPTIISGCAVQIGLKSKEELKKEIEKITQ